MNVMLPVAAHFGYQNLVLGAWGCGAFGNDPNLVAECFHTVLYGGGWIRHFERVVFAIKGRPGGANFSAFRKMFVT